MPLSKDREEISSRDCPDAGHSSEAPRYSSIEGAVVNPSIPGYITRLNSLIRLAASIAPLMIPPP